MSLDQFCRLCLEENESYHNLIEIFDDKENSVKISDIINLHFSWLEIKLEDEYPKTICMCCWNVINEFHSLYIKVETAHKELKEKLEKPEIILNESLKGNGSESDTIRDNGFDEFDSLPSVDPTEITFEELNIKSEAHSTKQLGSNPKKKAIRKEKRNIKIQGSNSKKLVRNPKEKVVCSSTQDSNCIRKSKSERLADEEKIREFFKLSCDECAVTFTTFSKLQIHQKAVHNHKQGFVYCCNKKINRQAKLFEHMNWHLNPDSFRCKICQKVYSDNHCLRLHLAQHTPEQKILECDICSKKFLRKGRLTKHLMLVHATKDNKDHTCAECGKAFSSKSVLQNHIRTVHLNLYCHICDICAKEFKSKYQYLRHRQVHLEAPPKIVCECGARLKNAMSLSAHIRQQHQKTPQICSECGKVLPNLGALRNHIRYHHRISRQYECKVCQKLFKKDVNLKEHMAVHLGITLYTCPYCPKTFNYSGNMHSHKKKDHFPEWQRDREIRAST